MGDIVRSRRKCCVIGCSSSEANNPDLHFYRFPGKSYEVERRNHWIVAIERINEDGQPWVPGPEARVCSEHFVGRKKSENMHHLAYVPRIFPDGRPKSNKKS